MIKFPDRHDRQDAPLRPPKASRLDDGHMTIRYYQYITYMHAYECAMENGEELGREGGRVIGVSWS